MACHSMVVTHTVNELIVGLYRYGREVPIDRFEHWAFERLREAIAFDSGMWREGGDDAPQADSVCLYGQPVELADEYVRDRWYTKDPLHKLCAAACGTTFGIADLTSAANWRRMPIYRDFARRYGIEWALSTQRIEPNGRLSSVITIWRHDAQRPFDEAERLCMQLLMPHLVEALRANRAWHFDTAPRSSALDSAAAMAVCDGRGLLHDTGRSFRALIRSEWTTWSGRVLPPELVACLRQGSFVGRRIDVDSRPLGGRWLLRAQAAGPAKRLGVRELQAARLYVQGLTFREVAERIGVAPTTVRNQLRSSFVKLGVSSKIELARRLGDPEAGGG